MSHINYNHLYYFWHVYKEGSVVGAAEALFLTPQTITGQIKALEERLQGKLFKRKGRGLEPSELGELVFRYADRMFTLSQEMLDIVNYRKESNLLFDVGVADALSKRLVSGVLDAAVVESEQIHLRCFESTHELLLEQLSQHKLDMIISDCPIDSTQQGRAIFGEDRRVQRQLLVHESGADEAVPGLPRRAAAADPRPAIDAGT